MLNTRRAALCAASIAALALAGCGSSNSSSSSSTSTPAAGLSRTALAATVNAACDAYNTAASALKTPADFVSNPASAAAFLDKLKPLVQTEYNAITTLTANASVKADFDAFVAAGKHQTATFNTVAAKAHAKDPTGLKDLAAAQQYKKTTLDPLATKLGFTSCLK